MPHGIFYGVVDGTRYGVQAAMPNDKNVCDLRYTLRRCKGFIFYKLKPFL